GPRGPRAGPPAGARLAFTDGGRELRYVDQRTFGGLSIEPLTGPPDGRVPAVIGHIARAPLAPGARRAPPPPPATPCTPPSTSPRSPPRSASGAPGSNGRCSTSRSSPASATST